VSRRLQAFRHWSCRRASAAADLACKSNSEANKSGCAAIRRGSWALSISAPEPSRNVWLPACSLPPATTTPTTTPVVTPPPVVVSSGSSASSPAPTPSVLGAASHHHPVILANVLTTTTTTVSNPPAGSVLGASAVSLPITGRTEETLLYFNALLATCFVSLFVYNNIKRRKRGVTNTK